MFMTNTADRNNFHRKHIWKRHHSKMATKNGSKYKNFNIQFFRIKFIKLFYWFFWSEYLPLDPKLEHGRWIVQFCTVCSNSIIIVVITIIVKWALFSPITARNHGILTNVVISIQLRLIEMELEETAVRFSHIHLPKTFKIPLLREMVWLVWLVLLSRTTNSFCSMNSTWLKIECATISVDFSKYVFRLNLDVSCFLTV